MTTKTKDIATEWAFVADQVMGGVSKGSLTNTTLNGRNAHRLTGQVSLDNDGGFIQMASDLNSNGEPYDAGRWSGIELDVLGNDEVYDVRLRTTELAKPWHSFRAEVLASADWKTVRLYFEDLHKHRHDVAFDPALLCRIGILAIGREFHADISISKLRFFAETDVSDRQAREP
jgi:hypothetical protein